MKKHENKETRQTRDVEIELTDRDLEEVNGGLIIVVRNAAGITDGTSNTFQFGLLLPAVQKIQGGQKI